MSYKDVKKVAYLQQIYLELTKLLEEIEANGGVEAGSGLTKVGDTINLGGIATQTIDIYSENPGNNFLLEYEDTTNPPELYTSAMYVDAYNIQLQVQSLVGQDSSSSIAMTSDSLEIFSDNAVSIYARDALIMRTGSVLPTVGQALICTEVDGPFGKVEFQDIPAPPTAALILTGGLSPTLTDGNGTTYDTISQGSYRATIDPNNLGTPGSVYYHCSFTITGITGTPGGNLYTILNDVSNEIVRGLGTARIISSTATPFYSIQSIRNTSDRIAFIYQDSLDANNGDLYPADNLAIGDLVEFSIECIVAGGEG